MIGATMHPKFTNAVIKPKANPIYLVGTQQLIVGHKTVENNAKSIP